MAPKAVFSFLFLLLFFTAGITSSMEEGQKTCCEGQKTCCEGQKTCCQGQKTWCVAKPSSDQATLLANINYACSQVDCRILQNGCPCSSPDNLMSHASIAMNLYYQSRGRNHWNCDFRSSGLIVKTDPSYGNCIYA